jgi:hypothetical protein
VFSYISDPSADILAKLIDFGVGKYVKVETCGVKTDILQLHKKVKTVNAWSRTSTGEVLNRGRVWSGGPPPIFGPLELL